MPRTRCAHFDFSAYFAFKLFKNRFKVEHRRRRLAICRIRKWNEFLLLMWFGRYIFRHQLHRHGDRTPTQSYPTDPYVNYPWPGGYGALSRKGARQLYNVGRHLRLKYKSLLPTDTYYTQENLHVLNSALERCLMSAESLLTGLMPPDECDNLLPLPWQPVPVNSILLNQDYVSNFKCGNIFSFSLSKRCLTSIYVDSLPNECFVSKIRCNFRKIINRSRSGNGFL